MKRGRIFRLSAAADLQILCLDKGSVRYFRSDMVKDLREGMRSGIRDRGDQRGD